MTIWDIFFPVAREISMAAFIGTTVLLLNGKKRVNWAMIIVVVANYLTAVYLTPLVSELSGIKSLPGIAFAIGVGGFSVIDRVINQIFSRVETLKIEGNASNNEPPE